MSYEITGTVYQIGEEQTFSSGFRKRQLVIETPGEYPQQIAIEFIKDKCDTLDNYRVGETVTVMFDIRGNEWNEKFYVNLQGWRIKTDAEQRAPERQAPQQHQHEPPPRLPQQPAQDIGDVVGPAAGGIPF